MRHQIIAALATLILAISVASSRAEQASKQNSASELPKGIQHLFNVLPGSIEDWQPESDPFASAMVKQFFPFVGREDLVERFFPGAFAFEPCPVTRTDALERIETAAQQAQIVIINEAHHQPLHRWNIQRVAERLGDHFEVFAAETFSANGLKAREPGSIPPAIGTYSLEPIFTRELYALDAAGFQFAAYEQRPDQRDPDAKDRTKRIALREEAQANNLIDTVLDDDPDARILIHVGYSHALEKPFEEDGEPRRWFAARLKAKTGIDPLTISQTHCSLGSEKQSDADKRADWAKPGALALANGAKTLPVDGSIDLFLIHPAMSFSNGRPDWRRAAGDHDVPVPQMLLRQDSRTIIEAYPEDAPEDSLPIERLMLYPGESLPLLLPKGDYTLTAWTESGRLGTPVTQKVSASE